MAKKIGIITHYYGSTNYGGVLQAYALCRKLNSMGYDSEQICYIHETVTIGSDFVQKRLASRFGSAFKCRLFCLTNKRFIHNMEARNHAIERFRNDMIPHSLSIYNKKTIYKCNKEYDAFITGSDQVWNMDWYDETYFLKFVKDKPKYAYAASLGSVFLTEDRKKLFKANINDFMGISVRESSSVKTVQNMTDVKVESTLDPTLLLDKEEWNKICAERLIEEHYLFCYFLGDSHKLRMLAKHYAGVHGLRIITLPHLGGMKRDCDIGFGDLNLYDVSPEQFISLIKYADCIFTDSFHASAFSCIYSKTFFSFPREKFEKMSNRITSLMELFKNQERFCDTEKRMSMDYFERIGKANKYDDSRLKCEREKSIRFLKGVAG